MCRQPKQDLKQLLQLQELQFPQHSVTRAWVAPSVEQCSGKGTGGVIGVMSGATSRCKGGSVM